MTDTLTAVATPDPAELTCVFCGATFTAPTGRAHCSLPCKQRHSWFGGVPGWVLPVLGRTARRVEQTSEGAA